MGLFMESSRKKQGAGALGPCGVGSPGRGSRTGEGSRGRGALPPADRLC